MSDSLQSHGLQPIRLFCPWDFPGKSAGVDCHFLLQGIFLTQESNPDLQHCKQTFYHLSHQGSPRKLLFNSWIRKNPQRKDRLHTIVFWASLVAQLVKNPPAMCKTCVWSLVEEISGEGKGYPFQYSGLGNSKFRTLGLQRVRHDWSTFTFSER